MCGRFALVATPQEVRHTFGYPEAEVFPPRYNIAPTQPIAVVRSFRGMRHFVLMRWGLVPQWVDDPQRFPLLINARAGSGGARTGFRDAVRYRRCWCPRRGTTNGVVRAVPGGHSGFTRARAASSPWPGYSKPG